MFHCLLSGETWMMRKEVDYKFNWLHNSDSAGLNDSFFCMLQHEFMIIFIQSN